MAFTVFTILCTLFGIFMLVSISYTRGKGEKSQSDKQVWAWMISGVGLLYALAIFDTPILTYCAHLPSWITHGAKAASYCISPPLLLMSMGSMGLYALIKYRFAIFSWKFTPLCSAQLIAEGVNRTVKVIVGRARPDLFLKNGAQLLDPLAFDSHYHSLPSGHATGAFVLAASLGLLYPKFRYGFYTLALLFSLSRVLQAHHYPTDIAAGALVGIGIAFLVQKKIEQAKSLPDSKQ